MKTQHTPGPWSYNCGTSHGYEYATISHHGHYPIIADLANAHKTEANARLIAAAPELLAALKECEELLTSRGINGASQQIMAARAAIAKAEAQA